MPLAIKIAPDLTTEELHQLAEALLQYRLDAVIATNTTIDKSRVTQLRHGEEQGGLSGRPLAEASTEVIRQLHQILGDTVPIIGVGGIASAADARDKLAAGASLLQVYTGFIYQGPGLIKRCVQASQ